jgi:RNA polymerase sigma-32 factor
MLFFSLARIKRQLARSGTSDQTSVNEEIAKKLRVKPHEVESMERRLEGRDLYLDAPRKDGEVATYLEALANHEPLQEEAFAELEERRWRERQVAAALRTLDRRERLIIERRFLGERQSRYRELGKTFGFSPERARQLDVRARAKLRAHLVGLAPPQASGISRGG